MKILSFDPAAGLMGWALLEVDVKKKAVIVLDHGTINGNKAQTKAKKILKEKYLSKRTIELLDAQFVAIEKLSDGEFVARFTPQFIKLHGIYLEAADLMKEYKPDIVSSEAPFAGRFPAAFASLKLVVDRVRQASWNVLRLPLLEYSPKDVKKVVTTNGNADKDRMKKGVLENKKIILKDKRKIKTATEHEIDAIGVGYTTFVDIC